MVATPPTRRLCAAAVVLQQHIELQPQLRQRMLDLELATAARMARVTERLAAPVTIPVVVHVVYRTTDENISTSQIKSQFTASNKDFRATNADKSKVPAVWKGLVADAGVEFVLATKDPNGAPTNGITRTRTTKTSFSFDDAVKSKADGGADPWPTDRYLNVWACSLGGGLLGYAQFPGDDPATDGVVILNTAFGTRGTAAPPFDLGRTFTHEVGHYLNLHHIWGDGAVPSCGDTDFVDDTPTQLGPNTGKPAFPHISCTNGPNGDMYVNYMDYSDDDSMYMFTPQQVSRMQAALEGPRRTLLQTT